MTFFNMDGSCKADEEKANPKPDAEPAPPHTAVANRLHWRDTPFSMSHTYRDLFAVLFRAALVSLALALAPDLRAQAGLPLYTDHLVNGFDDWSWGTRNLGNTVPVHSGSHSISLSGTAWQVALSLNHTAFDTTPYASLNFWANGGSGGGQVLQVFARVNGADQPAYPLAALPANAWRQFTIPLTALHADRQANFERLTIQLTGSGTANTFYLDDLQLTGRPAPALVHLSVNATQTVRVVDARWFGVNTAVWDNNFDTASTVALLREAGLTTLRFPGGSLSDDYHWAANKSGTNTWQWATSFSRFVHVATNVGAQTFITVNYGSGTPEEAAAWVQFANVTNRYGFRYWEIGNECYGTWETDTNPAPHDAYTYATRAARYLQQMKAADPTIRVGVVVVPGEDSNDNGYRAHPAVNPRTGQTHYGWTPVLLTTLKGLGVTPDFAIHHRYPEYSSAGSAATADSDPLLLQSSGAWAGDAADLRQQVTDYLGPAGTNVELVCTENNSDAGAQGRQSTSLVNGLYYADSLAQLMKSEFNAFIWWDLRNGTDTSGSFDPTLYGWRTYGDLGMINGPANRHPTFYAAKLLQFFARPGDTVLNATSDYPLLSAYAVRRASGALSLLVIHKDPTTHFTTQVSLAGFAPDATATLRSYGIPQDNAAQTGLGSPDIAESAFLGAAGTFACSFAPYSASVFTFAPAAPTLRALPAAEQPSGQFVLQLQGQPGVRYVLQTSTNLTAWQSIATNTLAGSALNFTNALASDSARQLWRAVWQP